MSPVIYYREVQRFGYAVTGLVLVLFLIGLVILLYPQTWLAGIILIATGASLLLLFSVLKLVTEVRDDGLYVRLFPLPFRRIALDDIESYFVRTYRPIREYGGWGLRFGFSGRAYNARGNRGLQLVLKPRRLPRGAEVAPQHPAVQLVQKSRRRVLIGSQQPEQLEAALKAAIDSQAA